MADSNPPHLVLPVGGAEKGTLPEGDGPFHEAEYRRLVALLEETAAASALPETPSARAALHDLLIRVRLRGLSRTAGA